MKKIIACTLILSFEALAFTFTPIAESELSKINNLKCIYFNEWWVGGGDIKFYDRRTRSDKKGLPKNLITREMFNQLSLSERPEFGAIIISPIKDEGLRGIEGLNWVYWTSRDHTIEKARLDRAEIYHKDQKIIEFDKIIYRRYPFWEPYRVVVQDRFEKIHGLKKGESEKTIEGRSINEYFCVLQTKELDGKSYAQLLFAHQGKPVWIEIVNDQNYKYEFKEFVGNFFRFFSMPPYIESADGKVVFLIDHSLKDKFQNREIRFLTKENDAPSWEQHYALKIEDGYVYFNTILSGMPTLMGKSFDYEKAPRAVRKVKVEYLIDNFGIPNFVLWQAQDRSLSTMEHSIVREGVNPDSIIKEVLKKRGHSDGNFPKNFSKAQIN